MDQITLRNAKNVKKYDGLAPIWEHPRFPVRQYQVPPRRLNYYVDLELDEGTLCCSDELQSEVDEVDEKVTSSAPLRRAALREQRRCEKERRAAHTERKALARRRRVSMPILYYTIYIYIHILYI